MDRTGLPDFEKIGGALTISGVAIAALGRAAGVNRFGLVGLGILGAGIICWGLSGLIEKRILFFHPGVRRSESYYGVAARAWGALLCLAGLGVAGFSIALFFEPDLSFERVTGGRLGAGIAMVLGGLAGLLYSVVLITGRAERRGSPFLRIMAGLPRRVLGIVLLILSLMLAATGLTNILFPQLYERVTQAIAEMLPRGN